MRILLTTQYFPPEIGAPSARMSELARLWTEAGHDVTVLTGMPNHPTGVLPPEYRRAVRRLEEASGHRVVRTWVYATPNEGVFRRALNQLSFMVSSVLLGTRKVGRPDVVVATSPSFFTVVGAWIISRIKRAPLVFEVRDLWPGIFEELGMVTNRRVLGLLHRLERFMYRRAAHIVVVTDAFRDHLVSRGVPAAKMDVVKNGVDLDRFTLRPRPTEIRRRLGAGPDDFLVLHLGNHGVAHGLESVADAARMLSDRPHIRFAFVGEGAMKQELEDKLARDGITNAISMRGIPREEVPDHIAAADVCLVPLKGIDGFEKVIPSKIFEFLAMGKACVGSLRGESASLLIEAGQAVVPPEAPEPLAQELIALAGDQERTSQMGARGRRFVEDHFDRRALADRYLEILSRLTSA